MELLLTSPITHLQLILGKFTGVFLFLVVMLVPAVMNILLLTVYSDPRPSASPYLVGLLGALLLGGSLLAVGVFISSLTENQIVAAATTFGVFIILWVLDAAAVRTLNVRLEDAIGFLHRMEARATNGAFREECHGILWGLKDSRADLPGGLAWGQQRGPRDAG